MTRSPDVSRPFNMRVALALLIAVLSSAAWVERSGYRFFDWRTRDVTADWVMTRAAFDGGDPYSDLEELGQGQGVHYRLVTQIGEAKTTTAVAFRPPGAFLLLSPILLLRANHAYAGTLALNVIMLIALALIAARIAGIRLEYAFLSVPLLIITKPIMGSFEWGTQSIFVGILVSGAWLLSRSGSQRSAGIAIAVAGTLKMFPILLVIPLAIHGKKRAAIWGASGFALLQLASIALFRGVDIHSVFSSMRGSARFWGSARTNGAIAGFITNLGVPWSVAMTASAIAILGLGVLLWRRAASFDERYAGTLIIATLASPLSWIHYDAALLCVAAWGFHQKRIHLSGIAVWVITCLFGWILLTWLPGGDTAGYVYMVGRLALLAALITRSASAPLTEPPQAQGWRASDPASSNG